MKCPQCGRGMRRQACHRQCSDCDCGYSVRIEHGGLVGGYPWGRKV